MKLGPRLPLPDGVTMKEMRSDNSLGKTTCERSIVAMLELGDGGAVATGIDLVGVPKLMELGLSCGDTKPGKDGLGETPEERRRILSLSE